MPDNASCITILFTSVATEGGPVINHEMGSGGVEWVTKSVQIAQPGQPTAAGAVHIVAQAAKQGVGVGVELHDLTGLMRPMVKLPEPGETYEGNGLISQKWEGTRAQSRNWHLIEARKPTNLYTDLDRIARHTRLPSGNMTRRLN